ncbi:MAG: chromosome segregation protein SMC [Rhodocyclaceae bacterium]|nr:chromosome segregation protein SMC [Rhodocyclaceae bacterium]
MRLTKLKLAGFKSFVDPTTVLVPGQLVGIVGPNGCGKSNIMDAVRWVLGESKATELRGESMQDVIFNGSGNRKPVSRASVELVFDNSLGRATGQWSQYEEVAVKRVLDRQGNSSYHLNNLQVRRRDVIDLFLGTGLGPRAYAIIGQGMISRIIEARPEDLRLFLEEAAGVTKYRERRKETSVRLEDARENLDRLEDIRNELEVQIGRLEAQAEVAARYQTLNNELGRQQALLWLVKRNAARLEREKLERELAATVLGLDEETARLRALEARLEGARSGHYAASDALHAAQSELYGANAEAARLEGELGHRRDTRRRVEARLAQLSEEESRWRAQGQQSGEEVARWQELAQEASLRVETAEARHRQLVQELQPTEQALASADGATQAMRRELGQIEQALRVEETHRANAARALESLAQRRARLEQEMAGLQAPDTGALEALRQSQADLEREASEQRRRLADAQAELPQAQARHKAAQEEEKAAGRRLTECSARREALAQLQAKVGRDAGLDAWRTRHGLDQLAPLWRSLKVASGWEVALEAVLRERLAALPVSPVQATALLGDPIQATLALALPATTGFSRGETAADSLLSRLHCDDESWRLILADWLSGVYCCEDLAPVLLRRAALADGEAWVNPAGQMVSRHALVFHAPDVRTHGVLERQEEIAALDVRLLEMETELAAARDRLKTVEQALGLGQENLARARREDQEGQQKLHRMELEVLRLAQARQRSEERRARFDLDREELAESQERESERIAQADSSLELLREQAAEWHDRLEMASDARREAEDRLRSARMAEQAAGREAQEARFARREGERHLEDLERSGQQATLQLERIGAERAEKETELEELATSALESALQGALEIRAGREKALSALRSALEEASALLRQQDEDRLRTEQGLGPLREGMGELRLKEQALRLAEEQCEERLAEIGADEAMLGSWLEAEGKPLRESRLNGEIRRLAEAIAGLGAVNLAALEEVAGARKRKSYLDEQSLDLNQAIATLEDAIRRMDRETRDQLQGTYDRVNGHFGNLFPQLFAGGEARLILTGDEILDAGIQVMARPPGKKNSTIHLLSGGEKALTAIALVFSLFQLNPAPFCLLDEVDAPLDDSNTERFCTMVRRMSEHTQFLFISHSKITMEMAQQLVGVTMQESGVSRIVEVDLEEALKLREEAA